jgi:hypothetical protein
MPSSSNRPQDLLSFLRMQGPTLSSELVAHFAISRATLSRRVSELGEAVVSIGKGRATQLAARHEQLASPVALYSVQENGQVERLGQLTGLSAGERSQWLLESSRAPGSILASEFRDGLFPGWPWFLEDLRPSGFLGRAFGKRMAQLLQLKEKPEAWTDFELLATLTGFGSNLSGHFILGDGRALADFQERKIETAEGYYRHTAPATYPELAQRALNDGEEYGSSAGGEQPKFTTMVCDAPTDSPRAVIVKFSPKLNTATGRRWADLLHAEHLANQVLRNAGIASAQTRIFQLQERIFLESERFDRVGPSGRCGLISLRALDAAYIGQGGGSWADCARKLHTGKWITAEDRDRMIQLHCFGQLIANTDMHFGNLSFFLPGEALPYPVAPVYDMLPMYFRPSGTGEVVERRFKPALPKPEDQAAWLEMYPRAITYWQQVRQCPDISTDFQNIAEQAITTLQHIHKIAAN